MVVTVLLGAVAAVAVLFLVYRNQSRRLREAVRQGEAAERQLEQQEKQINDLRIQIRRLSKNLAAVAKTAAKNPGEILDSVYELVLREKADDRQDYEDRALAFRAIEGATRYLTVIGEIPLPEPAQVVPVILTKSAQDLFERLGAEVEDRCASGKTGVLSYQRVPENFLSLLHWTGGYDNVGNSLVCRVYRAYEAGDSFGY